jgi:hypothetical protein
MPARQMLGRLSHRQPPVLVQLGCAPKSWVLFRTELGSVPRRLLSRSHSVHHLVLTSLSPLYWVQRSRPRQEYRGRVMHLALSQVHPSYLQYMMHPPTSHWWPYRRQIGCPEAPKERSGLGGFAPQEEACVQRKHSLYAQEEFLISRACFDPSNRSPSRQSWISHFSEHLHGA